MKHSINLKIKTATKGLYTMLMWVGIVLFIVGIGLAFLQVPLVFLSFLGLVIFLVTYFTVKEVDAENVRLILEANGDLLSIYRENNKGYQTRKSVVKISEMDSLKLIVLKGAFGIKYYCIEVTTKAKAPMNHKIIRLLSPVLEANENELWNIVYVIQKLSPSIKLAN